MKKSKWCLLIDVPFCLLLMPFMLIGALYSITEIGFSFGKDKVETWFMRNYDKEEV